MAKKKFKGVSKHAPSDQDHLRYIPFCPGPYLDLEVPEPKSETGAVDAGRAAAIAYLKHLRAGGLRGSSNVLSHLVHAMLGTDTDDRQEWFSKRRMLAWGFLSALNTFLIRAAGDLGELDKVSGEQVEAQIRQGMEKTDEQAEHEWRSRIAKHGWQTRRKRAAGGERLSKRKADSPLARQRIIN